MLSNSIPTHIPGTLIVQQLDGVAAGNTIETRRSKLDDRNSAIYGTSVFVQYINGNKATKPKDTDGKIVIGYISNGLPFQIVVDGFLDGKREIIFRFIDQYVTPLINDYAVTLSASQNADETIKTLIRTIFNLRAEHSPNAEFTMSIAITYKKNNQLYCAGFGIGDTGLVLRKPDGKIQQLAYPTSVNRFKDAFDAHSTIPGIERVINRSDIFNISVNPNDEIFGHTRLSIILPIKEQYIERYQPKERTNRITSNIEEIIVKHQLQIASIETPLFNSVRKENNKSFEYICHDAERKNKTIETGDDCTMGSVFIPTRDLQNRLKTTIQAKDKWHGRLVSEKNWFKRAFWNIVYFLGRTFSFGRWNPLPSRDKNSQRMIKTVAPTPAMAASGTQKIAQPFGGLRHNLDTANTSLLTEVKSSHFAFAGEQHESKHTLENDNIPRQQNYTYSNK